MANEPRDIFAPIAYVLRKGRSVAHYAIAFGKFE